MLVRRGRWQRTACAPVAPFEQDVQGRSLYLFVDEFAISAPTYKIYVSQITYRLLPWQCVAAQPTVISENGSESRVVFAQLSMNALQRCSRIIFCFEHISNSLIRKPAQQFLKFLQMLTFVYLVHHG